METVVEKLCEKYNLLSCIQCGRCSGGCPVSLRSKLNVRKIVYDSLKNVSKKQDLESISAKSELWECTTCATCSLRCPKGVSPFEIIVGLRGLQIEGGKVQPTIRDTLESVFKDGNPWVKPRAKRFDWAKELNLNVFSQGAKSKTLLYICCTAAYDPRIQKVSKNLVNLLKTANFDFAVLGEEESCCGNEIRRIGEEGLFEMLMEENVETFKKYNIKKITTISPHCYNAFKNEYKNVDIEVEHYTETLNKLILEGNLKLDREVNKKLTYHDPCFLGKQNKIFSAPREILKTVKGIELIELDRSKEISVCCEGGGGRMWLESEGKGERLAETRIKDAIALGTDAIVTSCPFCILTLEDATKTTGNEDNYKVSDITEILIEAQDSN